MNLDRVEAILRLFAREPGAGELTVEGDDWRLAARKSPRKAPARPSSAPAAPAPDAGPPPVVRHEIRAERVGIYRAPQTPLTRGAHVPRGGALGGVDSMRIVGALAAPEAGFVTQLEVEDGDPVEYGQLLLVLEPEPAS